MTAFRFAARCRTEIEPWKSDRWSAWGVSPRNDGAENSEAPGGGDRWIARGVNSGSCATAWLIRWHQRPKSVVRFRVRASAQGQRSGCAMVARSHPGRSRGKGSRWSADVKGKPVKPVRSILDIGCLTGSKGRMNDPEVTMPKAPNNNLVALDKAVDAASAAITLVIRVPAPLKSIAEFGACQSRGGPRPIWKRPIAPVENRLCLCQGGR